MTDPLARIRRWEFWPPWIFYAPLLLVWLRLALRYRSPALFLAANPAIPYSGLAGESKSEILGLMKDGSKTAQFRLLPQDSGKARLPDIVKALVRELGGYPVVAKPDVGERGAGVRVARTFDEALQAVGEIHGRAMLQEYVAGEELGAHYVRLPGDARGRVLGLTGKRLPRIVGDGSGSALALILSHPRLRCQRRLFQDRHGDALNRVLRAGEEMSLGELGNHCMGAQFLDASHLISPELEAALDRVARSISGFHIGRFDIRGQSVEAIARGDFRIIELNGVSGEPTEIYDPSRTLRQAYRTLARHWALAFECGARNHAKGVLGESLRDLSRLLLKHFRPTGARWKP